MKRRIVSVLLALVMCLSLVPTVAFADGYDGQVRVIVENTTYPVADGAPWAGKLVDKWVAIDKDSTMMSCVVKALGEDYTQTGAESNYITEINGLSQFDGSTASGWMGTLNDWFTDTGFGDVSVAKGTLADGDEIRIMYTCDWGADCGNDWSSTDKTVKGIVFSAGTLDKAFDKDTHAYTLTVPADTAAVTVTPTASNKNYQVRTFVGETEYKRTAAIPVSDGTVITVTCGDKSWPTMNNNEGEAKTYTFKVSKPVPAESISLNKKELTLNKSDKEILTATVTPDGATDEVTWSSSAEAVATVTNGVVTAVSAGTATITATAGTESDTCEVTVTDWKTVTVNVAPKTVNVTFYSDAAGTTAVSTDMVKDNGEKKVGNVTYHQYTLLLPDDLKDGGVYSYRGTEGAVSLGGEQFTVTGDEVQSLNLLRANIRYNGASLNQEGDYNFTLKNGENEVAYGEPYVSSNIRYTPTLLIAGVKHEGSVTLNEKWLDEFYLTGNPAGSFTNTPSKTATSAATLNLPITAYKIIRVTAPKEATTTFYKQDANYVVEPVTADSSKENEDGTVTYLFKGTAAHSNYQFRSMLAGKVTQAGYLADGNSVTVSFPDRSPASTASSLNYDDNSVLLNINEKNKLNLAVGDTFKLRAFRAAWEIVNNTSANQMIEPDFHFAVLSGEGVVSITPTDECSNSKFPNAKNGNATGNWMNVKAENPGTAVVAVWYDAIDVYNANPPAANAFSTFGATDPARYGIFVVTVGEDKNLSWNPVSQDGDWDSEFDTVYYVGDSGEFTFNPGTVSSVTVQNVYGAALGAVQSVSPNADGSYSVPVKTGANIICADGDYMVVRARQISYKIKNETTGEETTDAAPAVKAGDQLTISFGKLDMPIPKMSGIYNPGYSNTGKTAYVLDDSFTLYSAGTQYDFSVSQKDDLSFKVPSAGEHTLKGYISLSSMGDPFGNHRNISDDGKPVNTNASEVFGAFGVLPEIQFSAAESDSPVFTYDEVTEVKNIQLIVGGTTTYNYYALFNNVANINDAASWRSSGWKGLACTVSSDSYYNVMTLRYWYEGETPVTVPLTNGVAAILSEKQFTVNTGKILNLQISVAPADPTLGSAKLWNYVVYPDSSAVKKIAKNYYTSVGDSLLENAEKSTPTVGSIGGEWLMLGLARSGKLTDAVDTTAYYRSVVDYVTAAASKERDTNPSTDYSRMILALTAMDKDPTNVGGHDLTAKLGSMSYLNKQGTNGPVWALIALDSHNYAMSGDVTRDDLIKAIAELQMPSGGWYISDAKREEDVDMTAMAVQALAPYYAKSPDAKSAVDKALAFLSENQGANGDFGSSESDAQVVVALCALGRDPASNALFIKGWNSVLSAMCSYYADGASKGFKHTKDENYNQMATEQCYYALVAYDRFVNEKTALYDMSDVHQMTKTAAVAPTCTAEGNNEYWFCSRCNKYFEDEAGTTVTTVAAETLTKLGHDFTKQDTDRKYLKSEASCTSAAVYYYSCSRCAQKSTTDTFASGSTTPHDYGTDGKCKDCGNVNPVAGVEPTNVAKATSETTVGGKTVKSGLAANLVADTNTGLVLKSVNAVDDAKVTEIQTALTYGSTVTKVDNSKTKQIAPAEDGGKNALTALASAATGEEEAEIEKLAEAVGQMVQSDNTKDKVQVELVLDITAELLSSGKAVVAELIELPAAITVRIPISEELYALLQGKTVSVLRSHTGVDGVAVTTELPANLGHEGDNYYVEFASDQFSTFALISYENVGGHHHSSSSSAPTGARTITTDLPVGSINAVFVNGKKLDSKYYVINGSSVTLTEAYMSTLKAGRYTIRIENATHMSTATIEVAADGVLSARTGDAGVVLYIAMCAMSCIGSTALLCKRKEEA